MHDQFADLLTPAGEIAWRTARAQAAMAAQGLDALFIVQNADLYYFAGAVQEGLLAILAAGEPLFLVRRVLDRAREESPLQRIVPVGSPREYPAGLAAHGIGPLRRVGLELDVLPAAQYLRQGRAFPGVESWTPRRWSGPSARSSDPGRWSRCGGPPASRIGWCVASAKWRGPA